MVLHALMSIYRCFEYSHKQQQKKVLGNLLINFMQTLGRVFNYLPAIQVLIFFVKKWDLRKEEKDLVHIALSLYLFRKGYFVSG